MLTAAAVALFVFAAAAVAGAAGIRAVFMLLMLLLLLNSAGQGAVHDVDWVGELWLPRWSVAQGDYLIIFMAFAVADAAVVVEVG